MSRQMAVTKSVLPPVGVAASRFFHNKMVLQAGGGEADFLPGKKNFYVLTPKFVYIHKRK